MFLDKSKSRVSCMTVLYLEALAAIAICALRCLMALPGWCSSAAEIPAGSTPSGPFRSALSAPAALLWPVAGAAPNIRQWLVAALVGGLVAAARGAYRDPHRRDYRMIRAMRHSQE